VHNPWPPWVDLDAAGAPRLTSGGELVVRDAFKRRPGYERQPWVAPKRSSDEYRDVLRDIYLPRGLWPPIDADGRSAMAHLDDRGDHELGQRRALPGLYALPAHWRATSYAADLELARLAPAMGRRRVQRLDVNIRDELFDELRARARAEAAERTDLVQQLRELRETRSHAGDVTTPRAPICPGALADADAGRIRPVRPHRHGGLLAAAVAAQRIRSLQAGARTRRCPAERGRSPTRTPWCATCGRGPPSSRCTTPRRSPRTIAVQSPASLESEVCQAEWAPRTLPCAAYVLQPAVPHRCSRPCRAPPA